MPQNLQAVLPPPASGMPIDVPAGRAYRFLVRSAIVLGLAAILFALLDGELFRLVRRSIATGSWGASILKPALMWMAVVLSMMVGRTLLWFGYRPFEAAAHDAAPGMTVVIPAYNEGAMVEQSIESVGGRALSARPAPDRGRRRRQHRRHVDVHPARGGAPPGARHGAAARAQPGQAGRPRGGIPRRARARSWSRSIPTA